MPELPDLTVFAESLRVLLSDREVRDVVYHGSVRLDVPPETFASAVTGSTISNVGRVGKELLFELGGGGRFLVHLMLSGGFRQSRKGERVPFAVVGFVLDDEKVLTLFDPKRLARVALNPDLRGRAPDALEVTPDYLKQVFNRKPKALVKSLLLDQEFIGGIGNAYSDEILWQARISPKSPAGSIPPEAMERLASAIPSVLLAATDHLRKNHPGMISGEFRDFLSVHNRDRSVSPTGHRIVIEKVGSKKTYYTDEQEFFGRE